MAMLVASMAAASFSAFAQISQSDLPGRERDRFTEPVGHVHSRVASRSPPRRSRVRATIGVSFSS